MKSILFIGPLALYLASCNNPKQEANNDSPAVDSVQAVPESSDTTQTDIPEKAIELKSSWDSISLHKMSKISDTISFDSKDFKQIDAELHSDKPGNIRFNLIVLPDNNTDGPFGKDVQYNLDKKGTYKLVIGESLMQGDPFDGHYTIRFKGQ
ncbi:hypothetical protein [Sphingobacterium sp. NPDC055346]